MALTVLDDVSLNYDHLAKKIKADVESLYQGGLTARSRKSLAAKLGINGGSLFGDNVGKVLSSVFSLNTQYNT